MKSMDEFRADVYARAEKQKKERYVKMKQLRMFASMAAMLIIVVGASFAVKNLAPFKDNSTGISTLGFDESGSVDPRQGDTTSSSYLYTMTTTTQEERTSYTYTTTTTKPFFTTTTPQVTTTSIPSDVTYASEYPTHIYDLSSEYFENRFLIIKSVFELDEWIYYNINSGDAENLKNITEKYDDAYFKEHCLSLCVIADASDGLMNSKELIITTGENDRNGLFVKVDYSPEQKSGKQNAYIVFIEANANILNVNMYLTD